MMPLAILDAIPALISKVIDRVIPDPVQQAEAKLKVAELAQNGELEQLHAEVQLATGQMDINKVEAASSSTFVSGWRPFIGWICGAALAYVGLVEPLARFIAQVAFHYNGAFPIIDTNLTMQVLLGMLGLGTLRTYEKKNGVAS
jgi:hypothetical protein